MLIIIIIIIMGKKEKFSIACFEKVPSHICSHTHIYTIYLYIERRFESEPAAGLYLSVPSTQL